MFQLSPPGRRAFDPVLVNEPVYLRRAVSGDFNAWARLREASRAHLIEWEQDWAPIDATKSAFRRRLRVQDQQARQGNGLSLFVFRRHDEALLGGVTLSNIRYGAARTGSLGYWIGEPFVRRGYAKAAIGAVLDHAFNAVSLNRIEAACQPGNNASQVLLTRCGFIREGSARDYLKINGAWRDHDLYAITAREFSDKNPP